jgi:hypothetical protein
MEKFSHWRDEGTGIAPFLPVSGSGPQEIVDVGSVLSAVVGGILSGLTIPFAVIGFLLFVTLSPFVGSGGRQFLARLVLWFLKVYDIDLASEMVKRG